MVSAAPTIREGEPEPGSHNKKGPHRSWVPVQKLASAIFRCREYTQYSFTAKRCLLLPEQQRREHSACEQLAQRFDGLDTQKPDDGLYCSPEERAFIQLWNAPHNDRLNGTQRLALNFYRDGRYSEARQVHEIAGIDNGMPWALIRHLKATDNEGYAFHQIQKTFNRFFALGQQLCDSLDADPNMQMAAFLEADANLDAATHGGPENDTAVSQASTPSPSPSD